MEDIMGDIKQVVGVKKKDWGSGIDKLLSSNQEIKIN